MQASTDIIQPGVAPEPWYRQRWPWFLMLGPFLVVVAGTFTAWIAFSRQDALVVDDYYKQGKAINRDLRRDRAAGKLKLTLSMRYDPAAGRLIGTLRSDGKPFTAPLKLNLIHSTQPQKDLEFTAKADEQGTLSISLPMLEKARWQVLVQDSSGEWRLSGSWLWPHQQAIDIHAAELAPLD